MPRAEPPKRTVTLPGIPTVELPKPPELAPTMPAPEKPPPRKTWRLPTPPSALALARRSDPPADAEPPPTSIRVPPDEPAPSGRAGDREAILDGELAKTRSRVAELERDLRAATEAKQVTYPPKVVAQRSVSPVPRSTPSMPPSSGDWAKLRFKVATAIVGALVLVIAALAYWGVAAINAKTEAIKAAQEAKAKADSRDAQWRQWASVVTWIQDCRNGQQLDVNEMLLPAPDKMGSARKPEPWIVKCPKLLPPPP
jgi:hypothetical protein